MNTEKFVSPKTRNLTQSHVNKLAYLIGMDDEYIIHESKRYLTNEYHAIVIVTNKSTFYIVLDKNSNLLNDDVYEIPLTVLDAVMIDKEINEYSIGKLPINYSNAINMIKLNLNLTNYTMSQFIRITLNEQHSCSAFELVEWMYKIREQIILAKLN